MQMNYKECSPDKVDAVIIELLDAGYNYGQINIFLKKAVDGFLITEVETLCSKGVSDASLAKKLNVSYSKIALITTKYWSNKMKNKDVQECK